MKRKPAKSLVSLAVTASLLGSAAWSTASYACAVEPYISSVCIMAAARTNPFGGYMLATGTLLQINQYQALYSLIGATYGGDNRTNFNLPDLQGRVVVGTGKSQVSGTIYQPGVKGGAESVTLTMSQLPAHVHTLTPTTTPGGRVIVTATSGNMAVSMSGLTATATTSMSGVTANTTLSNLSGTTSLSGITANANLTGLTAQIPASNPTFKVSSGSAGNTNVPFAGAALGLVTGGPLAKIYTSSAPDTSMNTNSIQSPATNAPLSSNTAQVSFGGSAAVNVTGTATTTLTGNPTTTVNVNGSGSLTGNPSVTIGGSTDVTGGSAAVTNMPPYLAMNYYINVTQGLYPSYD